MRQWVIFPIGSMTATSFETVIPAIVTYEIRVIGLSAAGQFAGSFSDAITVAVQ